MQRSRHGERELRDLHVEALAVLGDEEITAAHLAGGRRELAAAGVLEAFAGLEQRLVPDDAEALDLDHASVVVLDEPVATDQLRRDVAAVRDANRIGERI